MKNSKDLKEVLEYITSAEVSVIEELDSGDDCFIDIDNKSSYNLFEALIERYIYAAETIRIYRFNNYASLSDKEMAKNERGTAMS